MRLEPAAEHEPKHGGLVAHAVRWSSPKSREAATTAEGTQWRLARVACRIEGGWSRMANMAAKSGPAQRVRWHTVVTAEITPTVRCSAVAQLAPRQHDVTTAPDSGVGVIAGGDRWGDCGAG